jgi:hypothetical protein
LTHLQIVGKIANVAAFSAVIIAGLTLTSYSGRASDGDRDKDRDQRNGEEEKIRIGFREAPVPLNLVHKNRDLVGLGSYLVNVTSDCNGCHSRGPDTAYIGNPYLFAVPSLTVRQTKKINPATYLGGGNDFGPFPGPGSPLHIFSRNLTPDNTGKPEGGDSFSEFAQIMRTGQDFENLHPTCPANTAPTATCVPYPFDGSRLQIMPWPVYQDMTEHELRAIYEYLSAIPCIDTVVEGQPQLRHTCPK